MSIGRVPEPPDSTIGSFHIPQVDSVADSFDVAVRTSLGRCLFLEWLGPLKPELPIPTGTVPAWLVWYDIGAHRPCPGYATTGTVPTQGTYSNALLTNIVAKKEGGARIRRARSDTGVGTITRSRYGTPRVSHRRPPNDDDRSFSYRTGTS
eukprot:scaffold424641_cov22-Prasinocladus_malaysianus.AAC.1